jgi:hypothetical protein
MLLNDGGTVATGMTVATLLLSFKTVTWGSGRSQAAKSKRRSRVRGRFTAFILFG